MKSPYVHGYTDSENLRLGDQAATLEALLHHDTAYPPGTTVLEAGCGVGAQTVPLVRNSPGAVITCLDISPASLAGAKARLLAERLPLPEFRQGDIHALPFPDASFGHVFLCFVLEHLPNPSAALAELQRVLRPGGSFTVIEGDHGSTLFHPDNPAAHHAIQCQVRLQRAAGGDSEIGRRLYPLLAQAGLCDLRISPRHVYVDASRPALVDGFIRKTFTTMIAGVRNEAIEAGVTNADAFDAGIQALLRTAEPDGVFSYMFFKATGTKPSRPSAL